jgi:hypothetical protein
VRCRAEPLCASLALLSLAAGCSEPQTPARKATQKADASLSAASVKVAEPVDLTVSVEHPEGTEALFPPVEAELGGLEVAKAGRALSSRLGPGWSLTTRKLTLRGFRAGAYTIEPLEIRLVDEETREGACGLTTPQVRLEVRSTVTDKSTLEDLREVKGPFELPPEPFPWVGVLLGALVVLALAAGALWLAARRSREELAAKAGPPRPPAHLEALRELEAIRELGLLEEGRVAEFADRVSDVLRDYLEARFELPAPERTTEEFLDEIARAPVLDRDRKRFLADYLAQCDLVKFAAAEPGRRELDELYDSSVLFVRETAAGRKES